ncbi:MAG TPA: glucose-1-phosphate adenylyltransferase subunit GlgD [Clostridiaceae bacterium]|nr:glucose-1-phosphate adenylyltransferase subunit GlgD [Clostridiaceae bacterium]
MKELLGVIDASENHIQLKEITKNRSIAAVPIGSRYRIIDFALSNMVNSGIQDVGIITQNHYNSLLTHLGPGKDWDLNRKRGGLFIFPPYGGSDSQGWYRGSVDALHSIMRFIRRSEQEYVLVSGTYMVFSFTYHDVLKYHIDNEADITILYKEKKGMTPDEFKQNTLIKVNDCGRVVDMEINPSLPRFNNIYMNTFIIGKDLLDYLLDECQSRGESDFVKDILLRKLSSLKIYGYKFNGYLACINSINAYYRYNMDLLNSDIREELFIKSGPVHTRVMDVVPAMYSENACVKNCIVADGCIIDGNVENSILFRGVKIYKGAKIKNSIIMQDSEVHENAILENVILDKEVIIRRSKNLIGQEIYPVVISKGAVI